MGKEHKLASKIGGLKGSALRLCRKGLRLTQGELAIALKYKSRDIVAKWEKGQHWPQHQESQLITLLSIPNPNFFTDIAAGVSYEQALAKHGPPTPDDPDVTEPEDKAAAVDHLERILASKRPDLRRHILAQLEILVEIAEAGEGAPTPAERDKRMLAAVRKKKRELSQQSSDG